MADDDAVLSVMGRCICYDGYSQRCRLGMEEKEMKKDANFVGMVCRFTLDAELKYTSNGTPVMNGAVANNYTKGGQDAVNFFDVSMFGKGAEAVAKYCTRGKQVFIEGRLQQERWEKDGQRRSKVVIVVNDLQLLGSGEGNRGSEQVDEDEGVPF